MTDEQEKHLARVIQDATSRISNKYRRGAEEHGTILHHLPVVEVLDFAIDEAVDQVVYLLTLRELIMGECI